MQTASGFLSSLLQAFSPFYGHHGNGVSSGEPGQDQTWLGRSPLYRFSTGRQSGGWGRKGREEEGKEEEGAVPMGRSRGIGVGTSEGRQVACGYSKMSLSEHAGVVT